jgi:hypothetical protein
MWHYKFTSPRIFYPNVNLLKMSTSNGVTTVE